ncbi:type VI secretion system tip protein VgrG [Pseudomonas sp. R1-18]|uniref:type VI secretion system Vgr family protein n=1 Tax=Pseudomonas sp. R1-18 TaxID=1632772 RepID=UPI003DA868C1
MSRQFSSPDQSPFRLFITGAESELQVLAFTGHEALNQPYSFELDLVSKNHKLDLEALLHQLAFLQTCEQATGFHGQIYSIARRESGPRLTRYRLTLRPRLAYLAHRINQRIFQHKTVAQIIALVLKDHGILADAYVFHLPKPYPVRDYCVQYDESDLQFIQRLCEEEGIHYHFQHSSDRHLLVFGDNQTVFRKLAPTPFHPRVGMVAQEPTVSHFGVRLTTRTGRVTRRDHDFAHPHFALQSEARSSAKPDLEDYDYPGHFTSRTRGEHLATRALERHRSDFLLADGQSDQPALVTGHFLELTGHAVDVWNDLWLLTEIHHEGRQPQVAEEQTDFEPDVANTLEQGYRNRFSATPWDVAHRPPLKHPKPKVLGAQNAVVTGPKDEEIHCDAHGRVKVQFFWDRDGQRDEHSSCWVRVASNWAGQQLGSIALPRVGMEVLVSFLESDPDQPLITGCLYNGVNRPPYKLPDLKALTTLHSKEYRGSRSSELLIDDSTNQISIALRSDHGASAISLGYLTHPRSSGGEPRGQGIELRTDLHGAIRAGAGLLITTEPRFNAAKHHLDLPETTERLATACDQQDGIAMEARHCLAQDSGDQDEVAKALHSQHQDIAGIGANHSGGGHFPEFRAPHLVVASPAGIALTASGSSHIATGEHLALSSTGHTSLSVGKRLLASASRGMRLFVQSMGWRLVAASGDIDIRALKDSINLLARLNVTVSADRITLSAKTELVIQGGGSSTTWNAGGITQATAGPHTVHAANHVWTGVKSTTASFPEPPEPGQGALELFNRYASQRGINAGAFEVTDALGMRHTGTLDAKGFARVAGAAPGPAQVIFGGDPSDTWSPSSQVASSAWPPALPDAGDIPTVVRPLIDRALNSARPTKDFAQLATPSFPDALNTPALPTGEKNR